MAVPRHQPLQLVAGLCDGSVGDGQRCRMGGNPAAWQLPPRHARGSAGAPLIMSKRPVPRGRDRDTTKDRRSLRVSDGFRSFVLDQLEPLGSIVAKAMFGGVGLYCDNAFFGIIARDVLYLKVDTTN